MKVLWHIPHLNINNAHRTIYHGYKNAFTDLNHEFKPFTTEDSLEDLLEIYRPDIFITSLHRYNLKYLNTTCLKRAKKKGLKVFVNVPSWEDSSSKKQVTEAFNVSNDTYLKDMIIKQHIGDVYYAVYEKWDPRITDFEKDTGELYFTLPLAADKSVLKEIYEDKFKADVSYIGSNLRDKKEYFKKYLYPLKDKYNLKIYGQGWSLKDRVFDNIAKFGKYFDIPVINSLSKSSLNLEDEGKIYKSSLVSINIHHTYQRRCGGDTNERTFKIPLCGGFEITDDVKCISGYFEEGKEIVIAKNKKDWFEKIHYYINNPEKRLPIIEAGRRRVLEEHTYHNRVEKIVGVYNSLK